MVDLRYVAVALLCAIASPAGADSWPQFRGPNGSGVAGGDEPLPADLEDEANLRWKKKLPPGRSSPVIVGGRIYLTATRDRIKLVTLCLDAKSGELIWEQEAPVEKLLVLSDNGDQAQSSCAASEDFVISYFGSSGLICYDPLGNQLWHQTFPPMNTQFGSGSSPILVDGRVILSQDAETDSFLVSIRASDGSEIWRTERPQFSSSFATPIIWENDGQRQIIVPGSLSVTAYDLETGEEVWRVGGTSWCVISTPVVGDDGTLYVSSASPGEEVGVILLPSFEEALVLADKDDDRLFTREEFEEFGPRAGFFPTFDRNKDEEVNEEEYQYVNDLWTQSTDSIIAIRPGGTGDITDTHVSWVTSKGLPFVPSPVFHDGHLFNVRNGGIVNSWEVETGQSQKRGRISTRGDFISSPVMGDGKIYFMGEYGGLSVISAVGKWKELGHTTLGEQIFASPAIADGRIYFRTVDNLYCFGYEDLEIARQQRAATTPAMVWWSVGLGGFCVVALAIGFVSLSLMRKSGS